MPRLELNLSSFLLDDLGSHMAITSWVELLESNLIGKRNPTGKALNTSLDLSPKSKPALKQIAGQRQVWRHITIHTVLAQEAIPEEGGQLKTKKKFW